MIDIIRIGNAANRVSVRVTTEAGAAQAGSNYEHVDEVVVFSAGETMQTIAIQVHPSQIWSPARELSIRLLQPSEEARLTTTHLHRARCWIIYSGPFPSPDSQHSLSRTRLFVGFLRMCWLNDGQRACLLLCCLASRHARACAVPWRALSARTRPILRSTFSPVSLSGSPWYDQDTYHRPTT